MPPFGGYFYAENGEGDIYKFLDRLTEAWQIKIAYNAGLDGANINLRSISLIAGDGFYNIYPELFMVS